VLKIGKVNLSSNVLMAPMAGFTDIGFRHLCRSYGAGLTYTEMVSMKGLKYNNARTVKMLITDETEKPSAVQIFGSDPAVMAEMCASEHISAFDIVDINMGCPVPKIVNNFEGSHLMRDMPLAEKVIKACRKNVKTLTVKFRKGFSGASVNAVEFAKMCEGAGADAVTVHGRTREQFYSGAADWDIIARVAAAVKIPVIGNGDIYLTRGITPEKMIGETGCKGVMIARGALGRPYVFSKEYLSGKRREFIKPSVYSMVKTHIEILSRHFDGDFIVKHMRGHLAWYLKEIPGGKKLKAEINKMAAIEEIFEAIKNI
jgi:nifR3 family TIM-barrel protein